MGRKVFISFLGGTNYKYCDYWKNGKSFGNVRFIQEATLNYLNVNQNWESDDMALILLTKGAESSNWVDNGQKDREGNIAIDERTQSTLEGLSTRLKEFKIKTETINNLPDGNDETEIWTIFERVFERIEANDELYFDITHGFRYLPMLVLVLCSYSKFLKNITVKSVTYGNFEVARDLGHGLIVDLLPLTQLQDWTYAAGQYLDSGNVNKLVEMSHNKYPTFAQNLKDTIADFHACRGISIIESSNLKVIKSIMSTMDTSDLPPLKFVFDKVKSDFDKFNDSDIQNVKNGYESAKWCHSNQLYQQAITILIETVITDICISEKLDWKRRKYRDVVSNTLFIVSTNTPENGWKIVTDTKDSDKYTNEYLERKNTSPESCESISENEKYKSKYFKDLSLYRQLVKSKRVSELVELSTMIKDIRDDIDHAGMRNEAKSFNDIEDSLHNIFAKLNTILSLFPCHFKSQI